MFEFTAEDLAANKRGQLSQSQREWLKMIGKGGVRVQGFNVWIAVGFMFLGLCITLGLYLSNEDSRAALFSDSQNVLILLINFLAVVGILALSILLARRNADKLQNAVVSSVSGDVKFDHDSSGESGITTHVVVVGKKKFKFAEDMSQVFQAGGKYRFYYCKAGFYEFVMSWEQVSNETQK